jgi:hypothetical protein
MSKKCLAFSKSKLGLEASDNRKAFYAGWDAALAQEEQEPVACTYPHCQTTAGCKGACSTAPPQRKPLTREQIQALLSQHFDDDRMCGDDMTLVRAIERAHGIGGSDE